MSDINPNDIAIISLNCRFPGAPNPDAFWHNLRQGVESITHFTDEELIARGVSQTAVQSPHFVKAAPILPDIDRFDAAFFGYAPREARLLDPQHRLFLECAWETLELAGYHPPHVEGMIGVYAGTGLSTYLLFNLLMHPDINAREDEFQVMLGNDKDFLSTRVSYHLNLTGPSLDVQTGCSTSLVAAHLACDSLLSYQCDMALVGGVSIEMPQRTGYRYRPGGITSPDGHCRPFDAQGQGTVFGSGVGVVLLKRLPDAIADGDAVHAVIKGSALNNDGSLKLGYTAPSVEGQAEVIARAQAVAGVSAETISYIEAHGTATALGDPIELEALTNVFRAQTDQKNFCALGAVKGNIGHLDAAAGIAGLIKTVLSLKHQQIPPTLHFQTPNPEIDLENSPFFVNHTLSDWPRNSSPRRAGVSSFGIGGTNAHLILEEAPPTAVSGSSRPWQLLLLSARTPQALEVATSNLVNHLRHHRPSLPDVAYTLQVGRKAFAHRRMVICQTLDDGVAALETADPDQVFTNYQTDKSRPVLFMFSGQGAQYVNMGRALYEGEPVFRQWVDQCASTLVPHLGLDMRQILYPPPDQVEAAAAQLTQTAVTQPALFVIEYALAQLWLAWGIQPQAMIGHSIGEFVAACLAGVFSLDDALKIVAARGRLMQQRQPGAMMAVNLPEAAVQPFLNGELALAAVNGPANSVLSGPEAAIAAAQTQLEQAYPGVKCRRLHTSHAFHSAMMEPALAPFRAQLQTIQLHPPTIPYISNVTGTWITAGEATDPDYWAAHMRQTVRFADGVSQLLQTPDVLLLEVGPGRALTSLTRPLLHPERDQVIFASLPHPRDPQPADAFLLTTIGRLWLHQVSIDWSAFYVQEQRHRVPLPTYPFDRQRHWVDPPQEAAAHFLSSQKKAAITDWFYAPSWQRSVPPRLPPAAAMATRTWLLFQDACGLGQALGQQLQQAGQEVVWVKAGEAFAVDGEGGCTIRPSHREDYDALLSHLQQTGQQPTHILHLWNVTSGETTLDLSFYSLLFLAQALDRQKQKTPVHIDVIATHLQTVLGTETVCPEKATLLGPCQVIPQEIDHLTCRVIDIVLPPNGASPQLIQPLLGELWAEAPTAPRVAYRHGQRWLPVYEKLRVASNKNGKAVQTGLQPQSVILITGGLGGLGLTMARYLAQTVQARLVLVGRSALPPREEWASWLAAHDDEDTTSQRIRQIQVLEEEGAAVLAYAADVTDLAQMTTVVTQAQAHFGPIQGVIHAAGVPGGSLIQLKTKEAAAAILAPKIEGTRVLESLFQEADLDFMVLFSSVTAVLGGIGQIDYCAANAFLDAFAQQGHLPVVAVNWDEWQEVGMAVTTAAPQAFQQWRQESLKQGILPQEGAAAFAHILAHRHMPQIIVAARDLDALKKRSDSLTLSRVLAELKEAQSTAATLPSNGRQATYVAPRSEIEQKIVAIWQESLGVPQVGIHDNFFDLGGNSLIGLQLVERLQEELGIELSAVSLYEGSTVKKLTDLITEMNDTTENGSATYAANQDRGSRRRARLKQKRKGKSK